MDVYSRRALGVFIVCGSALLFVMAGFAFPNQDFYKLFICFAFGVLGLGLRALVYGCETEEKISYGYYFVVLVAIISSVFLGLYGTFKELPEPFFYFIAFTLFASMGFVIKTVLNGIIK